MGGRASADWSAGLVGPSVRQTPASFASAAQQQQPPSNNRAQALHGRGLMVAVAPQQRGCANMPPPPHTHYRSHGGAAGGRGRGHVQLGVGAYRQLVTEMEARMLEAQFLFIRASISNSCTREVDASRQAQRNRPKAKELVHCLDEARALLVCGARPEEPARHQGGALVLRAWGRFRRACRAASTLSPRTTSPRCGGMPSTCRLVELRKLSSRAAQQHQSPSIGVHKLSICIRARCWPLHPTHTLPPPLASCRRSSTARR